MIVPGDCIRVRPGETIPVDGIIREGVGFLSEAPVSGEPFAVVRRPGDRALAGMASYDASLLIEATAAGTARQIDRLLQTVEEARGASTPIQRQADRLGRIFVPVIMATAIATFTAWLYLSGWQAALFNSMSVLLVACPCALGLTTPIVLWSALNRLAERGFVVHSGVLIERLSQVDSVFFDKTGTLTDDRFALIDIATFVEGADRAALLGWLAQIEEQSNHPIARPFAQLPRDFAPGAEPRVVALNVVPGFGLEATIEADGVLHRVRAGRPEWIGAPPEVESPLLARMLASGSQRRIDFEIDGRLAAIALVAERDARRRSGDADGTGANGPVGSCPHRRHERASVGFESAQCSRRSIARRQTATNSRRDQSRQTPADDRRRHQRRVRAGLGFGGRRAVKRRRPRQPGRNRHVVSRRPSRHPLGHRPVPRCDARHQPQFAASGMLQPDRHCARGVRLFAPGHRRIADGSLEPANSLVVSPHWPWGKHSCWSWGKHSCLPFQK